MIRPLDCAAALYARGEPSEYVIFYFSGYGWASPTLNYFPQVGPYFSLPEILRRMEAHIGHDCYWVPLK